MKKATRHKQTRQQDNKLLMDFLGAASASRLRTSSATGRSGGASPVDRAVSGLADGMSPTKQTLNGDTRRMETHLNTLKYFQYHRRKIVTWKSHPQFRSTDLKILSGSSYFIDPIALINSIDTVLGNALAVFIAISCLYQQLILMSKSRIIGEAPLDEFEAKHPSQIENLCI